LLQPAVLHKKTTIRSANGADIEGHVMVRRTDIAGGRLGQASLGQASLGQAGFGQAGFGQASLDTDRMCRRALKWATPRNQSCAGTSARFTFVRFSLRRHEVLLSATAAPAVYPFDLLTP
jgi:hypothetical protein